MSETADLSSDNERNPRYPPSSRATSSVYSISAETPWPDVIIISDSEEEEEIRQGSINHVVKEEQKRAEETFQAIKREFFFFLRSKYSFFMI